MGRSAHCTSCLALVRSLSGRCPAFVRLQFVATQAIRAGRTMTKDNAFKAILDSLPPKPARSRLEPYSKLILELHRRGRTYREIVRILAEQCGFPTSRSTVNDFVHARVRNYRKPRRQSQPTTRLDAVVVPGKRLFESDPETNEIQRRIAELKQRPLREEAVPQMFHYDPDKPLSLLPTPKKSK